MTLPNMVYGLHVKCQFPSPWFTANHTDFMLSVNLPLPSVPRNTWINADNAAIDIINMQMKVLVFYQNS